MTLKTAPVLALLDFHHEFVLETDASEFGIGAVLMQNNHPIAFLSQALSARNSALSTYEKECLAIILAVEKWRSYLQAKPFTIKTDHKSLLHLTDQRIHTKIQQKALLKLMDLDFTIVYKQGPTNLAADALSRQPGFSPLLGISLSTPTWLTKLTDGYSDDPQAQQLLTELSIFPPNNAGFELTNGIIRFKGHVWVGNNSLAQTHILQALHDSALGGHSGFPATYHRVKQLFVWPKMKQFIRDYVKACSTCQQAKPEHIKSPGLLQPLPIPEQAWSVVCMDFVEGLPSSHGFTVIMVIVDMLSKYAHFLPLAHPFTALQVAQLYFDQIYKLHGLPKAIISDRDKIFTSTLWQTLFRLSDTALLMSSSYHPQTDGRTERLNQCLETFLHCLVSSCPKKWKDYLPLAEFWYNTTIHFALGRSPFEVMYGHSPRMLGITADTACDVPDLDAWLKDRATLTQVIQMQLQRAQHRMKQQADKNRSEREFNMGDMVYLKLQPYVQASVAPRSNQKLSFRFYGPFPVLAGVGKVAYKLALPPACRIHPVIHVSQLKLHVPPSVQ